MLLNIKYSGSEALFIKPYIVEFVAVGLGSLIKSLSGVKFTNPYVSLAISLVLSQSYCL